MTIPSGNKKKERWKEETKQNKKIKPAFNYFLFLKFSSSFTGTFSVTSLWDGIQNMSKNLKRAGYISKFGDYIYLRK